MIDFGIQGILKRRPRQTGSGAQKIAVFEVDKALSGEHFFRFNYGTHALRDVLESRVIGEPYYLRITWTGPRPISRQGDVITDLGPDPIDLANTILRDAPCSVTCNGSHAESERKGEGVAFITTEHAEGIAVDIELSWLDPVIRRDVTVVGSRGTASLDLLEQKIIVRPENATEQVMTLPSSTVWEEITRLLDRVRGSEFSRWFESRASRAIGAEAGRVLAACRESLRLGRTVNLHPRAAQIHGSGFRGFESQMEPVLLP